MTTEMDLVALEKSVDEQMAELERLLSCLREAGDVEIAIAEELIEPLMAPIGTAPVPCLGIRG